MLTVNIIAGGMQRTIEAVEVTARSEKTSACYDFVEIYRSDGEHEIISGSDVYVMNDTGSTVAKYMLSLESSAELSAVAGGIKEK